MLGAAVVLWAAAAAGGAEPVVRTTHVWRQGDATLAYTAEAGRLDLTGPDGREVRARMFFVAYRASAPGQARPVTFVWNGGPGAPSATLHFASIGPTRVVGGRIVDNEQSILSVTDLVFVDAIGTGFSRAAEPRFEPEFYNTLGDIEAFASFVRLWRSRFASPRAPTVLLGESFGAPRAAAVAERLLAMGEPVDAVSLASGGLGLGRAALPAEWEAAVRLPEWAGVAMLHGKGLVGSGRSPDDVRAEVLDWASTVYVGALGRVSALSAEERSAIAETLARYSGLAVAVIDRTSLVITPRQFRTELLRDRGQALPIFDLRRTTPVAFAPEDDAAMERHLRTTLRYETPLEYVGLAPDRTAPSTAGAPPVSVNERWDYFAPGSSAAEREAAIAEAVRVGGGPPGVSEPWIRRAFALNPRLRVHVATGHNDAGQCLQIAETVRRLESPLREAYTTACYEGGHMMYLDAGARVAFARDLTALVGAVAPRGR